MSLFPKGDIIGLKRTGRNYHLITIFFVSFFFNVFSEYFFLHYSRKTGEYLTVWITNIGICHIFQNAFLPLLAVESLY